MVHLSSRSQNRRQTLRSRGEDLFDLIGTMTSETHHQHHHSSQREDNHHYHAGKNPILDTESPLVFPSSTYPINLDEITKTVFELDETFSSINTDEFLASILTFEKGQASTSTEAIPAGAVWPGLQQDHQPLYRQGPLTVSAPQPQLNILSHHHQVHPHHHHHEHFSSKMPPQATTIGEMTLTDFFIKAGVVKESISPTSLSSQSPPIPLEQLQWMQMLELQMEQGDTIMNSASPDALGEYILEADVAPVEPTSVNGGRRWSAELTMLEQRNRRMMKNRVSAARSRARKHAYTLQLEMEVPELRKENARLRQEQRMKQMFFQVIEETAHEDVMKMHRAHRRNISCQW